MSAASGEIEEAMEGQDSAGAEPVTEQTMREQSPLRTLSGMFGMGQLEAGTGQYGYGPVTTSSAGRMEQGVEWQNDGITDTFRMQNSPPIGFNMEVEEDGNFSPAEDRLLSDAGAVVDRLSPEGVKQMAVLLVAYLAGELPIEKWQELAPRQTVQYARRVLQARDDVVAQAVENLRAALDKSHEKGRRLAQEVLITQDGQRVAEEVEQQVLEAEKLAKYEVDELTHRLEECDQTIEELNAEIASTTQEMENLVSCTGQ